jgi:hypothetical protein
VSWLGPLTTDALQPLRMSARVSCRVVVAMDKVCAGEIVLVERLQLDDPDTGSAGAEP